MPDAIQGRSAPPCFVSTGLFPAGAVVGGAPVDTIGLRATLWVSLGLLALSAVPVLAVLRCRRDVEDLPAWHLPKR